jgi:hypothetical protein
LRHGRNSVGEYLKQRFVLDRADGKVPFRPVEPEPGSLTARDDKGGDLAGRYGLAAQFEGLGVLTLLPGACRFSSVEWRRGKICTYGSGIGLRDEISHPLVYFREVQTLDLCQQTAPLARIQLFPKRQKVALAVPFQQFLNVFEILLSTHIFKSRLEAGILGKLEEFFKGLVKIDEIHLTRDLACANIR